LPSSPLLAAITIAISAIVAIVAIVANVANVANVIVIDTTPD
jgi:hypothetical protein